MLEFPNQYSSNRTPSRTNANILQYKYICKHLTKKFIN